MSDLNDSSNIAQQCQQMATSLFGDTADYFNESMPLKRLQNIFDILSITHHNFAHTLNPKNNIHPKLIRSIINEGSFTNDKIATHYFAGILASSLKLSDSDDRGIDFLHLIDKLTAYQLRTHFLIYSTIRTRFKKHKYQFNYTDCEKMEIFIPSFFYSKSMKMKKEEWSRIHPLTHHSFTGLANHHLIETDYRFGYAESQQQVVKGLNFDGVICQPTATGVDFFLWAFGAGDQQHHFLFNKNFQPKIKGFTGTLQHILPTRHPF
ncbi:MAG: hypothetical protein ISP86_00185 [Shewanellaceae bacterium]|nr:hypothetical protein [Shewanellaceae bacterium]